jgi:23S rRNA (uracil1939-C5)-methyltransferase
MGLSVVQPTLLAWDARGLCAASRACGGCPQIETEPALARNQKLQSILQLLAEAKITPLRLDAFLEVSPLSYRNRIRLRVFEDGRFGFFNSEKSLSCLVLNEELRQALDQLRARLSEEPHALRGYAHLELRMPDMSGWAGLLLTPLPSPQGASIDLPRADVAELLSDLSIHVAESHWTPLPRQKFALTDRVFQWVPLDGFMQINPFINRALIQWLVTETHARSVLSVADLYAGSGNFLLPLLAQGYAGVGVENNLSSVLSARQALQEQGLEGEFIHSDVQTWMRDNRRRFSLIIVDAPRAGLRALADAVGHQSSEHVALVSCNPRSLVRDVARLVSLGYVVESLRVFDMFAYTDHVEVGVWLSRST